MLWTGSSTGHASAMDLEAVRAPTFSRSPMSSEINVAGTAKAPDAPSAGRNPALKPCPRSGARSSVALAVADL